MEEWEEERIRDTPGDRSQAATSQAREAIKVKYTEEKSTKTQGKR